MKKTLIKKAVMLFASLAVLIAAGIYVTAAWFTKNASVDTLSFDVAQWDFSAGYVVDTAELNVHTFSNVTGQKAAPGTNGYVAIAIDASGSDVDVNYVISVDESTMSEEFQDRLVFYYGTDWNHKQVFTDKTTYATGTVARGQTATVKVFWHWYYEMKDFNASSTAEERLAWDAFDTQVGRNPENFLDDMCATIRVIGSQARPQQSN